jgi:glycosyltransferase involved in cell wall biosynthesis
LSNLSVSPLISVVIPTYNRVLLLQKAIASVLEQTYTNWELIIVDDGSTDDTQALVSSLKDSRIHLMALPHNGNIASLRNAGVKAGSGEWIAFLDSDDEWVSNKLEIQLRLLLLEKKRWSYGGYELMDDASQTIPFKSGIFRPISGWIAWPLITTEAAVNIGSLMIERKLFNEVGGFDTEPKLLFREDYELALRLALNAEALAVPDLLVRVREHTNRSTNVFDDGYERTAYVYKHFLNSQPGNELEKLARKRMAYHLAEIAVNCMANRKYFEAIHQFSKAFINGDSVRHLLSAIRRGLIALRKK